MRNLVENNPEQEFRTEVDDDRLNEQEGRASLSDRLKVVVLKASKLIFGEGEVSEEKPGQSDDGKQQYPDLQS